MLVRNALGTVGLGVLFCAIGCSELAADPPALQPPAEHVTDGPWFDAWRWSRFGSEDGLPSEILLSQVEDPDGTFWFGTQAGLVRYDGWRFHVESQLPAHPVQSLTRDRRGRIWAIVGTACYYRAKEQWLRAPIDSPGMTPRVVACDDAGTILVSLHEDRFERLHTILACRSDETVPHLVAIPSPHTHGRPGAMLQATPGVVGLGASSGGFLRRKGAWVQVLPATGSQPAFTSMALDHRGTVWLGGERSDGAMQLHEVLENEPPRPVVLPVSSRARSVAFDTAGRGIAISRNGQVFVRADPTAPWRHIPQPPQELRLVRSVVFRPSGDAWVLSGRGLRLFRSAEKRWRYTASGQGLDWRAVNDLCAHAHGGVWVGCGGGVARIDEDGHWRHLPPIDGLDHAGVTGVAALGDQSVVAVSGSRFHGVRIWTGERWERILAAEDGSPLGLFHRIVCDSRGRMLLPELAPGRHDLMGGGGRVFELIGGTVRRLPEFQLLEGHRVYGMTEADDGSWWVALAEGVRRIEGGRLRGPVDSTVILRRAGCFSVCAAPGGGVFAAHLRGGLSHVTADMQHATMPDLPASLHHVWEIQRDHADRIWVSTSDGVACRADGTWFRVSHQEGLLESELWPLHVDRHAAWIGARSGGVWRLDLTALEAPGPVVEIDVPNPDFSRTVMHWRSHAHLGRTSRDDVAYRYRVDSGPWSAWSAHREVDLEGMSAGYHRLEVQAAGSLGRVGPIAHRRWLVPAPLHMQPLVVIPLALLLLGVGTALVLRTRRRRADRLFREQVAETQRLEAMGLLAGGVAHDFNNMLTTILANAAMGMRHVEPGSRAAGHLAQIEMGALHAAELTNQMLAYSGRGQLHMEPIEFDPLVRDLSHLLMASLGPVPGIRLLRGAEKRSIMGDPAQMRQVVMNLVVNAAESSDADSRPIQVSTRVEHLTSERLAQARIGGDLPAGEYLVLRVADNGRGMGTEAQARLFDPFFTTKATGRGLGLSAVAGIVGSHRGALFMSTRRHEGTTFEVALPVAQQAAIEGASVACDAAPAMEGRALVVDDDPSVRFVVSRALEGAGFEVSEAVDGRDGLEQWQTAKDAYRLVVVDCTMPGLDGPAMTAAIRADAPQQTVIAMSGYDTADMLGRFGSARPDAFVRKPFRPDELVTRIQQVLGSP